MKLFLTVLLFVFLTSPSDLLGQDGPGDEITFEVSMSTTTGLGRTPESPRDRSTMVVELKDNILSMRAKSSGVYYIDPVEVELVYTETDRFEDSKTTYTYKSELYGYIAYLFIEINTQGWSESGIDHSIEFPFLSDNGMVVSYERWDEE